jgi:hypothetical protein
MVTLQALTVEAIKTRSCLQQSRFQTFLLKDSSCLSAMKSSNIGRFMYWSLLHRQPVECNRGVIRKTSHYDVAMHCFK